MAAGYPDARRVESVRVGAHQPRRGMPTVRSRRGIGASSDPSCGANRRSSMTGWGKAVAQVPTDVGRRRRARCDRVGGARDHRPARVHGRRPGRARRVGHPGLAVHDVGDGHPRQAAVRGASRRRDRPAGDRHAARRAGGARRHATDRTTRRAAAEASEPDQRVAAPPRCRRAHLWAVPRDVSAGVLLRARQPARGERGVGEHQHDRRDLHRSTAHRTHR